MKLLRLVLLLVVISVPILFPSCKKTTLIGSNVLPGSDFINAVSTDTFRVFAKVEPELPVQTNTLSKYLLGSIKDPIFGTSTASIFTQVQLPFGNLNLGDSIRVDSVILSLPYYQFNSYYGIRNVAQSIKVYRITQSLLPSTTYYSNTTFSYDPVPLGIKTNYVPDFTDSITVNGVKQLPQLRIRLSAAFAQDLVSQSGTSTFTSNAAFQNYLNGLLITPDTSTGFGSGIMYFDMTSAAINLYCRHGIKNDSITFQFPINSSSNVTTDYYTHNYKSTSILPLLSSNANTNDTTIYLQSMGGLRARITIPSLQNLKNVLINKAELEVVQLNRNPATIDTSFKAAAALELLTDSANSNYVIEDINNNFLSYGGVAFKTKNTEGDSVAEYNVSLADQVQYIVDGKVPGTGKALYNSFFLRTFPNPEVADRIVAGGGNASKYKLVLHLVYTKLK